MATEAREDKKTLGVTPSGARDLAALWDTGWFGNEIDIFQLAIAVALREGAARKASEMRGVGTKWSTAIDADGRVRSMVRLLAKGDTNRPYAVAERYAAAGLAYLRRRLVEENAMLAEVLTKQVSTPGA